MAPILALNHRRRLPVLTITSRDSSVVGSRSPAAFTRTRVHLNLPLCLLLLPVLLMITAGEVFNECWSGLAMLAYCDAVTAIRCVRHKNGLCKKGGPSALGPCAGSCAYGAPYCT